MKYLFVLCFFLVACQKPVAQAPVVNYVYNNHSQVIVGDNNTPFFAPDTSTEQGAESVATADAKKSTSNMWVFWLILVIALGFLGWLGWKKGWIKL